MYHTKVKGEELFLVTSQGYGNNITTFGRTEKGETPVSLVNISLANCIAMCVQGYYASQEGNKAMPVEVRSCLSEKGFELVVEIGEKISSHKQEAILAYIEQKCRVKSLLRQDLEFHVSFI